MESGNNFQKIVFNHQFRNSIKIVWSVLRDINLTNKMVSCFLNASECVFDKGTSTYELGSEFRCSFKVF